MIRVPSHECPLFFSYVKIIRKYRYEKISRKSLNQQKTKQTLQDGPVPVTNGVFTPIDGPTYG